MLRLFWGMGKSHNNRLSQNPISTVVCVSFSGVSPTDEVRVRLLRRRRRRQQPGLRLRPRTQHHLREDIHLPLVLVTLLTSLLLQ